MNRNIIFHGEYFIDFYKTLDIHVKSNIYRVFCCFDKGNLIVLFNGFQIKSQKTPKKEIEKAMKLKDEYFRLKNLKS